MKILEWPHQALRTKCKEITEIDVSVWTLLDQMWETLEGTKEVEAMGLAANQVGYMVRIFIMRDSADNKIEFLNPEWSSNGLGWANEDEGCLSTPGLFGQVYGRRDHIKVVSLDRDGCKVIREAHGIDAVCIQHEIDHLDGIFWFDRMKRNSRREMIREWKKKGGKDVLQSV